MKTSIFLTSLFLLLNGYISLEARQINSQLRTSEVPKYEGRTEYKGIKTIEGPLRTTKGYRYMLDGVLLDTESFLKIASKRYPKISQSLDTSPEKWEGTRVRVKGKLYIRHCGANEQCLSGGEIPYMDSVKEVEIISRNPK